MNYIIDHWEVALFILVLLCGAVTALFKWKDMTKKERENTVKAWLLQAVILAEQQFGGKTGQLKLSSVFAEFCKAMPWLARVISFERFSELVDEKLPDMKKMLESNAAVAEIVEKKE